MIYIVHKLGTPLNSTALDVFISRLNYSLGENTECKYNHETSELTVTTSADRQAEIKTTINEIESEIRTIRYFPKKYINNNLPDNLEAERSIESQSPPSVEHVDAIAQKLEIQIRKIYSQYTNNAKIYPSLISLSAMNKCKYLHKFPQNAYVVEQFPHNYSILKSFCEEIDPRPLQEPSGKMLSPATCFHCYEEMSNQIVNGNLAIVAKSRCFRHEAAHRVAAHRLTEFNMIELIYIGDKDYTINTRNNLMSQVWELFCDLGLVGLIESASDPFYFPQDGLKTQFQLLAETKYELIAYSRQGKENFSVASFNYVSDSLCKSFNIQGIDGKFPHSGCVAFGIERLALSLFYRHGLDFAQWPEKTRKRLNA